MISSKPAAYAGRFAICALGGLTLAWAVASLALPFGWDQGVFAWIGDAIVQGGLPYVDAWDVKGPLTFYVMAALQAVFGGGMWGVRVFDLILLIWAGSAVYRIVRAHANPTAGILTALAIVLNFASLGYWDTAQPDGWAALLLVPAFASLVMPASGIRTGQWVGCGISIGLCVLFKPPYAALLAIPALLLAIRPIPIARRVRDLFLLGLAFAAPIAICVLWFAIHGAARTLFDAYIGFNLAAAAGSSATRGQSLYGMYYILAHNPVTLLAIPAAAAGFVVLWRGRTQQAGVLAGWLILALVVVLAQQRLFPYHWHVVHPPLGIMAGIGLARVWAAEAPGRVLALGMAVLLCLFAARRPALAVAQWMTYATGGSKVTFESQFRSPAHGFSVTESREAARWVARHTQPGEPVLVWADPMVNYLAERPSVGRFGFHVPVTAVGSSSLTVHQMRNQIEFLATFDSVAPRIVLVARTPLPESNGSDDAHHRFAALMERLNRLYVVIDSTGNFTVRQRR